MPSLPMGALITLRVAHRSAAVASAVWRPGATRGQASNTGSWRGRQRWPRWQLKPPEDADGRGAEAASGASAAGQVTAFDLGAGDLAGHARRLARGGPGPDQAEWEKAWNAVSFQAQGLAADISPEDAYELLQAFGAVGMLAQHREARRSLVSILWDRGEAVLTPTQVVKAWVSLDRAEATEEEELAAFFQRELPRGLRPAEAEAEASATGLGLDGRFQQVLALLASSGCSEAELRPAWAAAETAALGAGGGAALRAMSSDGLVAALRAAALAEARSGGRPSVVLVSGLLQQAISQARWLDGWAASHVLLACARLGAAPGEIYDTLRPVLLERCQLLPPRETPPPPSARRAGGPPARAGRPPEAGAAAEARLEGLAEVKRVAAALAALDVHDAEVRGRLAGWLTQALPAACFGGLALHLSQVGLGHAMDPPLARHVRARARSSELGDALGEEGVAALLQAYAQ